MNRRLLNALTVLSLLICLATCCFWVRSYWAYDYAGWWPVAPHGLTTNWSFVVHSKGGRLLLQRYFMIYPDFTAAELEPSPGTPMS